MTGDGGTRSDGAEVAEAPEVEIRIDGGGLSDDVARRMFRPFFLEHYLEKLRDFVLDHTSLVALAEAQLRETIKRKKGERLTDEDLVYAVGSAVTLTIINGGLLTLESLNHPLLGNFLNDVQIVVHTAIAQARVGGEVFDESSGSIDVKSLIESYIYGLDKALMLALLNRDLEYLYSHISDDRALVDRHRDALRLQDALGAVERDRERLSVKLAQVTGELAVAEAAKDDAVTDQLTGLPNRRAWDQYLAELIGNEKINGSAKFAMAIADIDHFKQVNDVHGHAVGDRVLKAVAEVVRVQVASDNGVATRWGGEEFVCVQRLEGDDLQEAARAFGERLRIAVADVYVDVRDGKKVQPKVSVGVRPFTMSELRADFADGGVGQTLFEQADVALYQAKNGGRNRVVVAAVDASQGAAAAGDQAWGTVRAEEREA